MRGKGKGGKGKGERRKKKGERNAPCRGKRTQPGVTPWGKEKGERLKCLQGQKIKINAMKRDFRHEFAG